MKTAILIFLLLASTTQAQTYPDDLRQFMIKCGVYNCAPTLAKMMVLKTATNNRNMNEDMSVTVLRLQFEAMKAHSLYVKRIEKSEPTRLEMIGACLVSSDPRRRYLAQEETSLRVEKFWTGVRLSVPVASWTGLEEAAAKHTIPPNGRHWSSGSFNLPLEAPDFSIRMTGK